MAVFRSFINAQTAFTAQARRAFSTAMYGKAAPATPKSTINQEMLYLQPRWNVQREHTQGAGKVLVGMIQKRWNSAAAQPVQTVSAKKNCTRTFRVFSAQRGSYTATQVAKVD